jgi:hypothetical protein
MNNRKYVDLDMHQTSGSVAVRDSEGQAADAVNNQTIPEAPRDFIRGLSGSVHSTRIASVADAFVRLDSKQILVANTRLITNMEASLQSP